MKQDFENYERMANIMKALAHPTRLFMVDKLNEKQYCVCELTEMIGTDVSTVSKHLSVLRNAGIIASRKENNKVFYRLCYPCVLGVYQCVSGVKRS